MEDAEKHPGEIKILSMPYENGGCIKAIMKQKFMDIRPEQVRECEQLREELNA